MLKKTFSLLICSLGLLVVAGCLGDDKSERIGTVTGRITIDGEPMAGASVMFTPTKTFRQKKWLNPISFGVTDEDGQFELSMPGGEAGAVVGNHRVMISSEIRFESSDKLSDAAKALDKNAIRAAYLTADPFNPPQQEHPFEKVPLVFNLNSKMNFTVEAGNNEANFEVGSPPVVEDQASNDQGEADAEEPN